MRHGHTGDGRSPEVIVWDEEGVAHGFEDLYLLAHMIDVGCTWGFDLAQDTESMLIKERRRRFGRRRYAACVKGTHPPGYTSN
jgi:hypothetical protein